MGKTKYFISQTTAMWCFSNLSVLSSWGLRICVTTEAVSQEGLIEGCSCRDSGVVCSLNGVGRGPACCVALPTSDHNKSASSLMSVEVFPSNLVAAT